MFEIDVNLEPDIVVLNFYDFSGWVMVILMDDNNHSDVECYI